MKGPGLRLDLDVRRLWRCPKCGFERRVPARQVSVTCRCTDSATFMQLIESKRNVRAEPPPFDPFLDIELEPSERRQRTIEPETVEASSQPTIEVPAEVVTPPPEAAPSDAAVPKEAPPSSSREISEARSSESPAGEDSSEKKKGRGRRRGRGGRGNRRRRGGRGRGGDAGGSSAPPSDKS